MQIDNTQNRDVKLPIPPVSKKTIDHLENYSEMVQEDYKQFKIDFLQWLITEGKDTYREEGFAESTVKTTHYKIDESYRWQWEHTERFTKEFPQDQAEELLDILMRKSPHPDSYVHIFEKALRRLFKYFREARNRDIPEWEHDIPVEPNRGSTKSKHIKDRLYADEMARLYEAAIQEYSIKSYWNVDPDERQELKRMIAQQQGITMDEIGPEEFKKASSWKYPAIISTTADLGLRPIEVGKMKKSWLSLSQNQISIPAEGSTKNEEAWHCEISSKSKTALKHWLQERQSYHKYDDTDILWLTKYGNQYGAGSLNRVLQKLIERVGINTENRKISYYSFRHGAASIWTENEGIAKAAQQLRHSNLETTRQYLRANTQSNVNRADGNW